MRIKFVIVMRFFVQISLYGAGAAGDGFVTEKTKITTNELVVRELNYEDHSEIDKARDVNKRAWVDYFLKEDPTCGANYDAYMSSVDDYLESRDNEGEEGEEKPRISIFIVKYKGKVIATLLAQIIALPAVEGFCYCFYIDELTVDPVFQGKSVGAIFLKRIEEMIQKYFPEVQNIILSSADATGEFYPKQGFIPLSTSFIDYKGELEHSDFLKPIKH